MQQVYIIFMTDIKTAKDHIILVPMDFSDASINAVYYAVEMANLFDSEIVLLHILSNSRLSGLFSNDSQIALLKDNVRTRLEGYKNDIKEKWPNVSVDTRIEEGKPFKKILDVANDSKCDTIVMGFNGLNGVEQFTGSTTTRVIKSSEIPVVVVKEKRKEPKFDNIVLPIDLTKTSKQKIDWAVKIAKEYNSTVHIIMELEKDEFIQNKAKANLKQAESIFTENGVDFVPRLLDDKEYPDHLGMDTIKYAEEINADLIMIMTQAESSALSEFFMGSYAEQVVKSSQKTPVMCINPKPTGSYATGGSGFY